MSAGQASVPVTAVYQISKTRTRSSTLAMEGGNSLREAIQLAKSKASTEESLTSLLIRFTAKDH